MYIDLLICLFCQPLFPPLAPYPVTSCNTELLGAPTPKSPHLVCASSHMLHWPRTHFPPFFTWLNIYVSPGPQSSLSWAHLLVSPVSLCIPLSAITILCWHFWFVIQSLPLVPTILRTGTVLCISQHSHWQEEAANTVGAWNMYLLIHLLPF